MDELKRLDAIQEKLQKASDRIKSGKRSKKDTAVTHVEALRALKQLMDNPNLSHSARKNLQSAHKLMSEKIDKERALASAKNSKPIDLGAAGKAKAEAKQKLRDDIATHVESNAPTQIKELGHEKQYLAAQEPQARPKSTASMSGPVKERMATGEGITVADRAYGATLDMQRQMKEKEAQIKAAKGPSEIVHIPKRYHEDDEVNEMMKLKATLPEEHHADIDAHISNRLNQLKGAS
jgi:hypothetical protein